MGLTKKLTLIYGVIFLLSCSFPVLTFGSPTGGNQEDLPANPPGITNNSIAFPQASFVDKVTGAIQEIQLHLAPVDDREVSSLHLRPAWLWNRWETHLDFAFYYNPWQESWQWGRPDPALHPVIANFIESMTYQGKNYELSYREMADLRYGYGLLLYDYHPAKPYRSIQFFAKLGPGARLSLTEPAEIRYLAPYTPDFAASLGTIRFETGLELFEMPWRLGITGIREENRDLITAGYPEQAWGIDLSLKKSAEIVPFIEAARFVNHGDGLMAGLTGRYTVVNYLAGYFRTDGQFLPNYFGGRYEDQKENTLTGRGEDALPDLKNGAFGARDGLLGGVWLDMPGLIKAGLFYLDDANAERRIFGVNLNGEMKPLKLKYGFSNYGASGELIRYDWYIQGSVGVWDYGYHHYYQATASREAFEVSVRL